MRQDKCSLSVKKVHYLGFVISENGLQTSGDKVNGLRQDKCSLSVKKVHYLGFVISENGLQTSGDKVNAFVNAPAPSDVPTQQSFLGLVNFYHRFVPGISTILHPLNQLLRKDAEWNWSAERIAAFDRIKQLIAAAPVLAHYDLSKPLILESDASPVGLGACLLQEESDGSRISVHFLSRSLSSAESHYSQIGREALAIAFAVQRLHSYLHGRKFIWHTDHKLLLRIFGRRTHFRLEVMMKPDPEAGSERLSCTVRRTTTTHFVYQTVRVVCCLCTIVLSYISCVGHNSVVRGPKHSLLPTYDEDIASIRHMAE